MVGEPVPPPQAAAASSPASRIALVGLPGSGKTSVARHLAGRIGWRFVDADHEIESRTGTTIANIFAIEGEQGFRDREERMLDELTQLSGVVLATGGGAVLRPANRERLKARAVVVYLRASPDDLALRLRKDRSRPLLQGTDPRVKLRELFAQRDPLYREVAQFTVDTGRPHAAALATVIVSQLELAGVIAPHRIG